VVGEEASVLRVVLYLLISAAAARSEPDTERESADHALHKPLIILSFLAFVCPPVSTWSRVLPRASAIRRTCLFGSVARSASLPHFRRSGLKLTAGPQQLGDDDQGIVGIRFLSISSFLRLI
jgi:hypothetical protein